MRKNKTNNVPSTLMPEQAAKTVGKGLTFEAAEAYKLLRTNLAFSLPDLGKSKAIGITSALPGEAKTTTSINLAYSLAEAGKKVLLLEADMRLSVLSKRLNLRKAPGLSNLLVGQSSGNEVLQNSGLLNHLKVITAGTLPPNPAELLDSEPMEVTIRTMRDFFDYVIVDLPPVIAVSDALVASKYLDGVLVVVRQDCCDKKSLADTVRQLKFSQAKVLGFVVSDSARPAKKYRKNYYGAEAYRSHGE